MLLHSKLGSRLTDSKHTPYKGVNPQTGIYQFSDGKGGLSSAPDTSYLTTHSHFLNAYKKYSGGLGNNIKYKNWQFNFFLSFSRGNTLTNFFR